ncbi:MAG: tetratricopeptide repeat protein [Deltaproteobacteria bacterium]|nr:tetratricopeptide repeat protein [Deltaproteobacteria bacterium]
MKKRITSVAVVGLLSLFTWGCATPAGKVSQPPVRITIPPVAAGAVKAGEVDISEEAKKILADIVGTISHRERSSTTPTTLEMIALTKVLPSHPYPWLMLGLAALNEGKDAMARRAFQNALQLDAGNPTALLGMGDLAEKTGNMSDAEKYYARVFKSTGNIQAAERLAYMRVKNGRPDNAIPVLQPVFDRANSSEMVRNTLAVALDLAGLSSEALDILGHDDYNNPTLFGTRAKIELKEGRPDLAEEDLERLFNRDPGGPETVLLLGVLNLQKGNLPVAEENFRKFIELTPQSPDGYLDLGLTLRRRGRFRDAESVYEDGINATDDPDLHLNLGVLYELYLGSPEKALAHYRKFSGSRGGGSERVQGWIDYLAGRAGSRPEKERPKE